MNTIISGKVIRGKSRGKKLGFPTANIALEGKIESGVYTGIAKIANKEYKAGIFVDREAPVLEVHLIGFSGDLYGEEIEVAVGERIRDISKFEDDDELREQIHKDIKHICSPG